MAEHLRVVVTGASSGIGRALALQYARHGAQLGLIARRRDRLEALSATLPVPARIYAVDVRDAAALAGAADDFIRSAGCPDIVIANAGISGGTGSADAADNAVFEEILSVNLTGMMMTFQPFIESMRARGSGTLAGIASVAGFRGLPGASAYSASKAAAIAYLESLRVELRGSGVRVATICPGYVDTPMTSGNRYRMPFLLDADSAARLIVASIDRGRSFYVLPWQMAAIGWMLRRLPNFIYDRVFAHAPRKARRVP